jgi:predicted NodU family carbamoyl transferase
VQFGKIIAEAQEVWFACKKHEASFPKNAVEFFVKQGGTNTSDLGCVGFYDKPFIKVRTHSGNLSWYSSKRPTTEFISETNLAER